MNPAKHSLPALTSLRFFAALLVVLCHFLEWPTGHAGVAFFFVLSGFILAYNHDRLALVPGRVSYFWFRRFARVYPTHLLTFLAALPLAYIGFARADLFTYAKDTLRILLNLSLLQAWVPSLPVRLSFNPVAWSLSCEAFFYLLFPFAVAWLGTRPPGTRAGWSFAPLAVVVTGALLWTAFHWPAWEKQPTTFWLFYFLPLSRMAEFLAGAWLGLAYAARPWHAGSGWQACALLSWAPSIATSAWLAPWLGPLTLACWYVPSSLLTLFAFAPLRAVDGRLGHGFTSPLLLRLGRASFMLYMTHLLAGLYGVELLREFLGAGYKPGSVFRVAMVPVTVGVAELGYRCFEHPAQRLLLRAWPAPRLGRDGVQHLGT